MGRSIDDIPFELLDVIFNCTTPPYYLLDHSLARGSQSAWSQNLRFKKTLVHVCKKWYKIGIFQLYDHVTFRRCGQICAFRWTLENNPSNLASLVRRMRVDIFVVENVRAACEKDLEWVFKKCTKLRELNIGQTWRGIRPQPSMYTNYVTLPPSILHYGCTLSDFLETTMDYDLSPGLFSSLKSLTIDVLDENLYLPVGGIMLNSLEILRLYIPEELNVFFEGVIPWTEHLFLPSLCELNVYASLWRTKEVLPGNLLRFLKPLFHKHGSQLTYLQFRHPDCPNQIPNLNTFLSYCPNLVHLSVGLAGDCLQVPSKISHPTIRWLDVFYAKGRNDRDEAIVNHCNRTIKTFQTGQHTINCPKLKGVRWFCPDGEILHEDLPRRLSDPVFFKEDFEMKYPGVSVRYRDGIFTYGVPEELGWEDFEMDDDDDGGSKGGGGSRNGDVDGDEDWEYMSSSGNSGSEYSCVSMPGIDKEEEEEEELSHDGCVDIFRKFSDGSGIEEEEEEDVDFEEENGETLSGDSGVECVSQWVDDEEEEILEP